MALDVYFRSDIANIIRSANQSGGNAAATIRQIVADMSARGMQIDTSELSDRLDLYQQGYSDALGAVAVAFGIFPGPDELINGNRWARITQEAGE